MRPLDHAASKHRLPRPTSMSVRVLSALESEDSRLRAARTPTVTASARVARSATAVPQAHRSRRETSQPDGPTTALVTNMPGNEPPTRVGWLRRRARGWMG